MRIVVTGQNFFPERVGIGVYTHDMCKYFAAAGHDVEVVTGFPFYPEMRLAPADEGRRFRTDIIDGITVRRCYVRVPRERGMAGRLLTEMSFGASSALRLAAVARPDVMVVISPPFVASVGATLQARARRIPIAVHLQDLQTDAAGDLGLLREGPLLKIARRAERSLLSGAGLVSTLDEGMRARVIDKGVAPDKVVLFPNWMDMASSPAADDRGARFRGEHGLEHDFLVVYSGSMGVKHGLDLIIRVAGVADDPAVRFLLIGDGAVRQALEAEARRLRLSNVMFLPLQPAERFAEVIAASDVSLIPQRPEVRDLVVPSKLLRIMAGGSPVVGAAHPESGLARVLRESGGGIAVQGDNPQAAWAAIAALKAAPARRAEMGRHGREFIRTRFDRDAVLGQYLERLRELSVAGN